MASHDVGIGDFVLLDEITVERVVENLKTRCVHPFGVPTTWLPKLAESQTPIYDRWTVGSVPRAISSRFVAAPVRGRGLRVGR